MQIDIQTARVFKPLLAPSRYKGCYGGRGSAKSHFFAEYIIERCISAKVAVVCCREIQRSIKHSVKKLLEYKIEALGVEHLFEIQDQTIKGINGSEIIFQGLQSHTADSIKSLEGFDICWIEEAQSISQKSLDMLRPTIRKPGSELLFSWNPGQPTDPIDALLRADAPPPGSIVIKSTYQDNPWFPEELRAEMEYDRSRDADKFRHIWEGEYLVNNELRVFSNWRIEDFERPEGTMFRLGADWGFSVDPSVLIRCDIQGNNLYVDYEAYRVGCEIVNLPLLFMQVPDSEKWPIIADSARPETISHMRNNGFPKIQSAIKGPKSIEDGIEFLKSFDIIVHPRCKHTIDELSTYAWKPNDLGLPTPVLADKNNHVIDALRYACEGARRAVKAKPKLAFKTQPLTANSWMGS
jgi:phage terminase large subunit